MTTSRRKAREIVLQALYEQDLAGHNAEDVLKRLLTETPQTEENAEFIFRLTNAVVKHKDLLDENIRQFASAWPVEQLSYIDRNVLRLAIFEIIHENDVPIKVAINEAVELAKSFGGNSSARFINGVLSSVSKALADTAKQREE
ncbi:MAG: transcription antitermination factor NusB [Dehalococcoides mccartyi]|uniref:Transcription antitermination protein NusB n=2 Tax=root TaxID=1 RepID=A0A0V8M3F3_9CHLR|nr:MULTISPECIES: transcription antitermination factor NusB [Dehalococcoides]AII59831.1 nitrogen utilization protein B [Dehalococcoides mccartyi CG4]AQU03513.1 N utilization substance protein B [Dehalococcoides mccartyi]AQU04811.1 N utilization substance protein B [Dehalococcoides mccartyi]KSV18065.1 nitrogen utilization protein B [Dehalococcoides mccartyi]MBF4482025.1 transcription antitermination factor NusB [Dehalococcoides mccartyi]